MNFFDWCLQQLTNEGVNKSAAQTQLNRSKQELPGMRKYWQGDVSKMSEYDRSEALLAARTGLGKKDEGV
jgi:hypothetical protein